MESPSAGSLIPALEVGGGEGRSQPASPTKVTVVLAALCPLVEICGASGEGGTGRELLGAGSAPPGGVGWGRWAWLGGS